MWQWWRKFGQRVLAQQLIGPQHARTVVLKRVGRCNHAFDAQRILRKQGPGNHLLVVDLVVGVGVEQQAHRGAWWLQKLVHDVLRDGGKFWHCVVSSNGPLGHCCHMLRHGWILLLRSWLKAFHQLRRILPPRMQQTICAYVIVGAGSAGCLLANRLSAAVHRVLLLESGPPTSTRYS